MVHVLSSQPRAAQAGPGAPASAASKSPQDPNDSLSVSSTASSASAALARSLFLYFGFMFRRPSKLFRPSRVDTWGGLRQLAISANQNLSPSFLRTLLRTKSGLVAILATLLPPLVVNTSLGFLLFTSHSFFSLGLARLPFFQQHRAHPQRYYRNGIFSNSQSSGLDSAGSQSVDTSGQPASSETSDVMAAQGEEQDKITLQTLIQGPSIVPRHPTLLSAISGAGAGVVQGLAFTPVENVVRLLSDSATSITAFLVRVLRLPIAKLPIAPEPVSSPYQALRNFLSSDAWRRSPSWWTGWRWAVARDAVSYSCFFAAFDMTRRVGLRVKALFGGGIQSEWGNFVSIDFGGVKTERDQNASTGVDQAAGASPAHTSGSAESSTPTIARVAQATTIVAGGIAASIVAELAGRPFKACQKIMQQARLDQTMSGGPSSRVRSTQPILEVYRKQGLYPFLHPNEPPPSSTKPIDAAMQLESRMRRGLKRVGWRLAAVGPWGFGFLVWAWVGGEV